MNNNLSRFADSKVYFQCPICTKSMDIQGNSLICRHGHCFDISRYGYVNLLLKSSPKTNYSKRSFDNRHQILEYGMYDVVLEKIIQFISDTPSIRNILDVGCGEGFYARQIQQRTERNIFAFDLSREAIQIASKKDKRKAVKWFVTDLSKIPLKDGSMDCILDIFSPAHYKEFQRLLSPNGYVVKVIPTKNHLREIRTKVQAHLKNPDYSNESVVEYFENNDIVTTGNFNDGTLKQLQHTLWKGYDSKPSNLDNRALVSDTKHVNTTIAQAYINNQGQHVTITDAELYLTFLTERAGYLTSIGYYYYKTNDVPNSPDKVDKFIIIPNASIAGDDPYTGRGSNKYSQSAAPIERNTKIQLLYQDENGNVSTKFPAGYTIGYFIIPNGYTPNKGIDYSINYIYSNKEWNKIYAGQQARFISLSTSNGTVVYGVEDGDDTSYEDILFCIDANPNEAIQDPDRPVIDPEEPTVTSSETTYRTYAYEDIWPNGGDYDLNDVIIEHKRAISFNSNNYVLKVEDTFVPVQKSGAATYSNAFAVQYVASQRGSIELPAGAVDETETSSVILFPDAKSVQGNEFTVTRTFADNTLPKKNLESDLNPFIIAQYTAGADNRTEVHLPKKKATGKANAEQIGAEDDAYYINKDGKYPFAIMLPATTGTEGPIRFTPAKETVRIDLEYPDFAKWVESNGATNNDWYLYYQSSKE